MSKVIQFPKRKPVPHGLGPIEGQCGILEIIDDGSSPTYPNVVRLHSIDEVIEFNAYDKAHDAWASWVFNGEPEGER